EDGTECLSFGPNEKKMGWKAQPTRQVFMENVRVPLENRIGDEGTGFRIAMSGLDGGRLNIGASSLGGAQSALEKAITYLGERQAFGQDLTGFQALRFEVADRKSTRLNSSHVSISYAVFCLKKKKYYSSGDT